MKRVIAVLMVMILTVTMAAAEMYDLPNMTRAELEQLKRDVNEQLTIDHEPTGSEKSRVESVLKTYVEDTYGADNVSWAWIDYSYTKDWDYFTVATHADVKKGGEKSRCDIRGELFRKGDDYQLIYLLVGNDELLDIRDTAITDERVRAMLGMSASAEPKASEPETEAPAEASAEPIEEPEADESDIYAKRGDRNDSVKDLQTMLIRLGYLSGKADGDYGGKTETAVKAFQRDNGMEETGMVTTDVYEAISAANAAMPEPVKYEKYTAKEVYAQYESNEIAADSKFKGKVIEVSGKIDEIGTSVWGTPYVYLKADSYGFKLLHFEFSKKALDQLASLKEGKSVTIRAKCTGMTMIVVYFDDSEIVG